MQAAEAFGLDPDVYFQKGRESRMAMVAYIIGKNALSSMQDYDMGKKRERELENKRHKGGNKPRARGRR